MEIYAGQQRSAQADQAKSANSFRAANRTLASAIDQPQDPRLHAINNAICLAAERVRAHTDGFNSKADCIVGTRPEEAGQVAPSPVPNGALDQIDMALRALSSALDRLGDAERRFVGLA